MTAEIKVRCPSCGSDQGVEITDWQQYRGVANYDGYDGSPIDMDATLKRKFPKLAGVWRAGNA